MASGRGSGHRRLGACQGRPLETHDFWFQAAIEGNGVTYLRFEGLATFAEVYLDGALILTSDNMFLAHEIEVELSSTHQLHLCFRALEPMLAQKHKRARWRPRLPSAPNLRFIRTTLLGHAPGWFGAAPQRRSSRLARWRAWPARCLSRY
jgi:beta-mannosidase